ncbi:Ser-tRNA(Ala) deacylase AlaX [Sporomusaceae bacterium BoRhaA]|uniref:alanyl-tRNA editing protein n=1 Tax=Pelorhabdus rhamnosifermentans TaxID=2772457 RepID=UPI001C063BAF|nr:alanyl-tRNA editing protein [Pelorhabdus rhamnosifermentans]MBU2699952.1 Ser-tRNA(Ala) deacylase AlaX [Pelorhabdus rhamnosifermentans]
MQVKKVFWDDPYLTELTAKVTSINGGMVTVDRTIAYAFSGGQESDYGTINQYPILNAEKIGKQIVYSLEEEHDLHVDDEVLIKIDWERRYKLMRLHFAAEIILELVYQNYNRPEKIGAHISVDKARLDFFWQGNISQTFDFLEREANRLIDDDVMIKSEFSDQASEIRYWEIENFARVSCGGTHIKKTGEIGKVSLKRNNIGKGKERIEIILV